MTESELNTLLSTDSGITAITTRVTNGELPEGENLPAVTFEFISDRPVNTLKGDTGHAYNRYTINVWASNGDDLDQLEAAVRTAMSSQIRLSRLPLHEPKESIYRIALDYSIYN
jgi:hypothetical protein